MAIPLSPYQATFTEDQTIGLFGIKDKESTKKRKDCEAKGGKWDGTKCVFPQKEQETPKAPQPPQEPAEPPTQGNRGYIPTGKILPNGSQETRLASAEEYAQYRREQGFSDIEKGSFEVLKDKEGKLGGFIENGKVRAGLRPEQVRRAVGDIALEQELPVEGQASQVLDKRALELQQQGAEFAGQIGDSPDEATLQQLRDSLSRNDLDHMAALASSAPGIVSDFIYGAGAVATLTKGQTKGIGPIIGGVVNSVRGVFTNYVRDISGQQGEIIETPIRTLTESKGVMTAIIGMQNSNPAAAQENLKAYNTVRTMIDMEYEYLKELSDEDLNKFLGENAINQMKEYEVYYAPYGERWQFDQEMANALANPDPTNTQIPYDIQQVLAGKVRTTFENELE